MLRVIFLSAMLLIPGIFTTGCISVYEQSDVNTNVVVTTPEELEQQEICETVKEHAYLVSSMTDRLNQASNLKTKYEIEACKKVLFEEYGYGIVTFTQYDSKTNINISETGIVLLVELHEGRWVVSNAQPLYMTEKKIELEDEDLSEEIIEIGGGKK